MAEVYRKNLTPHLYRRDDPLLIQKERSDIYTERAIRHVYRENDPTCIQKEPSWALNEVTID